MKRLNSLMFSLALAFSLLSVPVAVRAEETEPVEETPMDVITEEQTEDNAVIEEVESEEAAVTDDSDGSAVPGAETVLDTDNNADMNILLAAGDEEDVTPPVLLSVEIDKTEVEAGGRVLVTVHAEDDTSAAQGITVTFRSVSGEKTVDVFPQSFYWDSITGERIDCPLNTFAAELPINEYAVGEYRLDYVDMMDSAGNRITYMRIPQIGAQALPENCSGVSFTVHNDDPDTVAPVINALSLSKTEINGPDDTLEAFIDVTDDKSGFAECLIVFTDDSRDHQYWIRFWEDNYTVFQKDEDENWFDGVYCIDSILLTDKAGNTRGIRREKYSDDEIVLPDEFQNISITFTGVSPSGSWQKTDGRWWYEYEDGSYPFAGPETISGVTYLFDYEGYLTTGWLNVGINKTYYADANGIVQTSKWVEDCYLKENGVMARSEWVDNDRYYVDRNGKWMKNAVKGEANEISYDGYGYYQLVAGNTQDIEYRLLPADVPQDGTIITWTTDNSSIATVDAEGTVTALTPGSANITGTIPNGQSFIWHISVIAKLERLEFKEDAIYRYSDEMISRYEPLPLQSCLEYFPQDARGAEYTISSTNESVLQVFDSWALRAVGIGTSTVTVTSVDDPSISTSHEFEIYRSVMPESISINEFPSEIYLGYAYPYMEVVYGPENARQGTIWTSSDPSIIEAYGTTQPIFYVNAARKPGTVTITAASEANPSLSASKTITVKEGTPKSGTFTTSFEIGEYDLDTHQTTNVVSNPASFELEVGKSYEVYITCEGNDFAPGYQMISDAGDKFIAANAFLKKEFSPPGDSTGSRPIITMAIMAFTVTGPGSATFSFGGRTMRLYVEGAGHWESNATGWWYVRADGTYPANTFEEIDGKTYYFNASGYMVTGWQNVDGEYYFFQTSGAMKTNAWEGNYYLLEDGRMAKNRWVDNEQYYVGADGKWIPNYSTAHWESNSTGWWYVRADGSYPANTFEEINGKTYYFNAGGYMVTGWQTVNGEYYFFEASGAMKTNAWEGNYYLLADGRMARDQWVDNNKYYVDKTGKWHQAHWESNSTGWWYVNEDTTYPVSEFKEIGGKTYYFDERGYMAAGWKQIAGEYYFFEISGAMKTSAWEGNYYLLADGRMAKNQWVDNDKYYVDENGAWVKGKTK